MTGTVHDRAIAAELREQARMAARHPDETVERLRYSADRLERRSPPAIIGADHQGDEPAEGTVLKIANEMDGDTETAWDIWYRYPEGDGWYNTGDSDTFTWEDGPLQLARDGFTVTVLEWGDL